MARTSTTARARNRIAVTHGCYSPEIVESDLPVAVARIRETLTYVGPADELILQHAGRILAQVQRLDAHIERLGGSLIDSRGRPRGCTALWLRLGSELRATLKDLGATPAARAAIVGDLGSVRSDSSLAQLAAARRAV